MPCFSSYNLLFCYLFIIFLVKRLLFSHSFSLALLLYSLLRSKGHTREIYINEITLIKLQTVRIHVYNARLCTSKRSLAKTIFILPLYWYTLPSIFCCSCCCIVMFAAVYLLGEKLWNHVDSNDNKGHIQWIKTRALTSNGFVHKMIVPSIRHAMLQYKCGFYRSHAVPPLTVYMYMYVFVYKKNYYLFQKGMN